jgi:hypothetical protein
VDVVKEVADRAGLTLSRAALRMMISEDRVNAAFRAPLECVGGTMLYPDPIAQAAILAARLVKIGSLPLNSEQGAALLLMEILLETAGVTLDATATTRQAIFCFLAEELIPEERFVRWVQAHTRPLRALN